MPPRTCASKVALPRWLTSHSSATQGDNGSLPKLTPPHLLVNGQRVGNGLGLGGAALVARLRNGRGRGLGNGGGNGGGCGGRRNAGRCLSSGLAQQSWWQLSPRRCDQTNCAAPSLVYTCACMALCMTLCMELCTPVWQQPAHPAERSPVPEAEAQPEQPGADWTEAAAEANASAVAYRRGRERSRS